MKEIKKNSSNFQKGDLAYGIFCDRLGIIIEVDRISDGYQVVNVLLPNGHTVVEHECYWVHLEEQQRWIREIRKKTSRGLK